MARGFSLVVFRSRHIFDISSILIHHNQLKRKISWIVPEHVYLQWISVHVLFSFPEQWNGEEEEKRFWLIMTIQQNCRLEKIKQNS